MNDFEFLKTSLRSLIDKMEHDRYYTLEVSVDALCSIARYYEKMGSDYKSRQKLNKKLDEKGQD